MKIVTIAGSIRKRNYTAFALAIVQEELNRIGGVQVEHVDPAKWNLPFPGVEGGSDDSKKLQRLVSAATGIILATPEYHGSFSSIMKLVIENLGFPSALAGKPVGLLGVASGRIGAIKSLEHLRSVCSHVGALVLPGPISIARVRTVFDEKGKCLDAAVEVQIRKVAHNMMEFIQKHICPKFALEELVREGE